MSLENFGGIKFEKEWKKEVQKIATQKQKR